MCKIIKEATPASAAIARKAVAQKAAVKKARQKARAKNTRRLQTADEIWGALASFNKN